VSSAVLSSAPSATATAMSAVLLATQMSAYDAFARLVSGRPIRVADALIAARNVHGDR